MVINNSDVAHIPSSGGSGADPGAAGGGFTSLFLKYLTSNSGRVPSAHNAFLNELSELSLPLSIVYILSGCITCPLSSASDAFLILICSTPPTSKIHPILGPA